MTDSLQAQIQRVIDIEDIRTLMAKYCHGIDRKDEETFMGIWAADGAYMLPRGEARGTDEIRALVHRVWRQVPKCHHHITNPVIEVTGDTATAKTDVIYFRETDDGLLQLLSGGYDFAYARRDGLWKTTYLKFSSFVNVSPIFKDNIRG